MSEDYLAANRANWNERADIHIADETGFYRIAEVLAGANVLTPIERAELGDIAGLKVAHFQCHIGTDTLSLKRMGAAEVVGLDFSPQALAHARALARRTGLDIRFVEGTVFDAPALIGSGFDLVFTSWGTIGWYKDIEGWARAVAGVLKPGGRLYFADGHPTALILGDGEGGLAPVFDYETPYEAPLVFEDGVTYTGSLTKIENARAFEWTHSISRVLNALIDAGLRIEHVAEHEALPWAMYSIMTEGPDHLFRLPPGHVRIPLAWSIQATKS